MRQEFLASGSLTLKTYEIQDEIANGVNVKFSRFCYDDVVVPTIVKEVSGRFKVDFRATLKAQMQMMKSSKPNKKYCFDFENRPLSGKLNGQAWQFVKTHHQKIDWGNKVSISTKLYGEDCDASSFGSCGKSSLIISNLDLSGDGGNFNNTNNVTIHVPPSENLVVSTGSYRITNEGNQKKIELSFNYDDNNVINGFFLLEATK